MQIVLQWRTCDEQALLRWDGSDDTAEQRVLVFDAVCLVDDQVLPVYLHNTLIDVWKFTASVNFSTK